jgi:hypothetical protein
MMALFVAIPVCAGTILSRNNTAWSAAGFTNNAIRASLQKFYSENAGDPQVVLIGVPDNIHGAYVTRNAIDGMTKYPQLSRDIKNCLPIARVEQVIPFGYLKDSLVAASANSTTPVHVLYWNNDALSFRPISLAPINVPSAPIVLTETALAQSIVPRDSSCTVEKSPNGVTVSPGARGWQTIDLKLPPLNCARTDVVVVDLAVTKPAAMTDIDLFYKNDIVQSFDREHFVHGTLKQIAGTQRVAFALHAQPDWALGGTSGTLALRLPPQTQVLVTAIASVPRATMMPQLSSGGTYFTGTKGFLHLSQKDRTVNLHYSASEVPGAAQTQLEITRTNQVFEEQNSTKLSRFAMTEKNYPATSGDITLNRADFPTNGLFELRAWALDQHGNRLRIAGDHMVLSVDD